MQRTITLEVADEEFSQAHQAALQAGFAIEEYLNIVVG
jgi:hypothetical protein